MSCLGTHGFIPYLKRPPETAHPEGTLGELRETMRNRSFLVLFAAGVFFAMASGLAATLGIYFNTFFWELGTDQMSVLALVNFVSAAIAFVATPTLSRRLGKRSAAILVSLAVIVIGPLPISLRLLGWFPPNGSPAVLPILAAWNTVVVAFFIVSSILVSSMIADVVEDNEVVTGRRAEGVLFAANAFVQKAVSGIGIFASSLLLTAVGFPRGAQPGAVDPAVVRSLGLVYAPLFVAIYGLGIACVAAYRIDRASHEANLRRLATG